jgi:hypothetical protein
MFGKITEFTQKIVRIYDGPRILSRGIAIGFHTGMYTFRDLRILFSPVSAQPLGGTTKGRRADGVSQKSPTALFMPTENDTTG